MSEYTPKHRLDQSPEVGDGKHFPIGYSAKHRDPRRTPQQVLRDAKRDIPDWNAPQPKHRLPVLPHEVDDRDRAKWAEGVPLGGRHSRLATTREAAQQERVSGNK